LKLDESIFSPMSEKRKLIDLSIKIEPAPGPEHQRLEIQHENHADTAEYLMKRFACSREDLPDGLGWANDYVTLGTHVGTHIDAPWHYHPTSEGKKAKTIDEIPVEWFYGDGVVIDMRHKGPGELIDISDLEEALRKIPYEIKPYDIVLVMTGADKLWGTMEYWSQFPGLGRESTLWLCNQGVKVMGTDSAGWDRPFWAMVEEFKKTGDSSVLWGAHFAGIEREYCQIEKLTNLDQLPSYGFKVACFPMKVLGGSAGWARPVAIIEE
jgi:kynurenine formamidase